MNNLEELRNKKQADVSEKKEHHYRGIERFIIKAVSPLIKKQNDLIDMLEKDIQKKAMIIEELSDRLSKSEDTAQLYLQRIEDIEGREEWTRNRFAEYLQRIEGIEGREEWTRNRFAEYLQRIEGIEGREEWTRNRFAEYLQRIEDIEGREEWARNRFAEYLQRIKDIEGREEWTRNRIDEHLDQILRVNTIIDSALEKQILQYPVNKEGNRVISDIMMHGKTVHFAVEADESDNISRNLKMGKLICSNIELLKFFEKAGTFIDLGANIGAFSLAYAANGWNGYAIEASSVNSILLKTSVDLNNYDVTVIPKAVYEKTGRICFVQNGPWGFVQNEVFDADYEELDAICLNDYKQTAMAELKQVDLIKMDIEGSEVSALRGMDAFVKEFNYPPIISEANAYALCLQKETPKSLIEAAELLGYTAYIIKDSVLYKYSSDIFPMEYCMDFFFVKDVEKLCVEVRGEYTQDKEAVLKYIIEVLEKRDAWKKLHIYGRDEDIDAYSSYICYCLKDFPQYYNDAKVKALLDVIKEECKADFFVNQALEWYK